MKICPVCGDATFDDQPICFGCLHRYEGVDGPPPKDVCSVCPFLQSATLQISLVPADEETGSIAWSCTMDPNPILQPPAWRE